MMIVSFTSDNVTCQHSPIMSSTARTYRGQSSEDRRALRRKQFIQAGIEVFGEVGYHAATVKQLCQSAGLTERYFYEAFGKREALFAACYDQELDRLLNEIIAALKGIPTDPTALAEAGLTRLFTTLQRERHMARILLVEIYGVRYDQDRLFQRSIGRFSELIQKMALAGSTLPRQADFDPDLLSAGLVGVCIQMALRWLVDGFRQPPEDLVHNCMLIFTGLSDRIGKATP